MRSAHILDSLQDGRSVARKRSRATVSRGRPRLELAQSKKPASRAEVMAKKVLIIVESEGAVFDTLALRHEEGYLPAFAGCFSWGTDPSVCADLWRRLSLSSRLRGQDPLLILLSALRLLNRGAPSVRRAAVIKVLDSYLASASPQPLAFASAPKGSPERLILDWLSMSDSLLEEKGYAPVFPSAHSFLSSVKSTAPGAEILVHSSLSEDVALNQWEMAGLGDCFLRIAGAERGDFAAYLRTALKNGYDADPILVVGTTIASWQAAQAVGARFYPVMPDEEDESWSYLAETFFPAFMVGETALDERDSRDFMRMMLEDIDQVAACV